MYRVTNSFFIFLTLITLSLSCVDDCSGRGWCLSNNECECNDGWYDDPKIEGSDCFNGIHIEHPVLWDAMRYTSASFYGILCIILIAYLFADRQAISTENVTSANVRRIVLISLSIACLTHAISLIIDPRFTLEFNQPMELALWGLQFPVATLSFVSILFNWINLYNVSVASMKREEMLQQINKNYRGKSITIEDIITRVRFLARLKIPFMIVVGLVFAVWIIVIILVSQGYPSQIDAALYIYIAINWITLAFGFLTYGRKLVTLMPPQLIKKVRRLTTRLTMLSIFCVVALLVMFGVSFGSGSNDGPMFYVIWFVTAEIITYFIIIALVLSFVKRSRLLPCIGVLTSKSEGKSYEKSQSSFALTTE